MKKTILFIALMLLLFRLSAQTTPAKATQCGYEMYWDQLEKDNPGLRQRYTEYVSIGK